MASNCVINVECFDTWQKYAEYDMCSGSILKEWTLKDNEKCTTSGIYSCVVEHVFVLYVHEKKLVLVINKKKYLFSDCEFRHDNCGYAMDADECWPRNIEIISKSFPKKHDKIEYRLIYPTISLGMEEEEDFDFGLFLLHLSQNKQRQDQFILRSDR